MVVKELLYALRYVLKTCDRNFKLQCKIGGRVTERAGIEKQASGIKTASAFGDLCFLYLETNPKVLEQSMTRDFQ
jgi:hypothetical protein